MIKEYLDLLTKDDIKVFFSNSIFLEGSYIFGLKEKEINEYKGEKYAFFNVDFNYRTEYEEHIIEKLPSNFIEIGDVLLKLGAIGTKIRQSTKYEDGFFAIDDINFNKIELLNNILFNRKSRKNNLELDKIVNKLKNEGISTYGIVDKFGIKNSIVIFNDIDVMIHAISIKEPKILNRIKSFLNIENILDEKREINKKIDHIIPKWKDKLLFIYDNNNNLLFDFTATESKIFKELKSKIKEGGLSLYNLNKITKQPTLNATEKTVKQMQTKIKKYKLKDFISVYIKNGYISLHIKVI